MLDAIERPRLRQLCKMKIRMKFMLCIFFLLGFEWSLGAEQCVKPADVAFVLDSSTSIRREEFEKQKAFVQELVKMFDIGPTTTRVAAVTFGRDVREEFLFKEENNKETVLAKVGKIEHLKQTETRTDKALEYMRTELFATKNGARENVAKVCILLTDGKSEFGDLTIKQAEAAKQAGIKILAVGIGSQVNDVELKAVVTAPSEKYYFKANTFDDLKSKTLQELVGFEACKEITTTRKPTTTTTRTTTTTTTTTTTSTTPSTTEQKDRPEETCQGKEADIVLIVDMSSSIWTEDFKKQLSFLSDLIDIFDIDSGKTKIGMIAFSDQAKTQFYLDEYTSKQEIAKAILSVRSEGGITNTHLALQKLLDDMLTRKHGSRPGVAHICILITDGRSSKPDLTLPEAQRVHDSGVYVFAIGVGNMTDKAELQQMASKPELAFEVNGYQALPKIKDILAYKTCEVPQDEPRCTSDIQADIMFGLYGIGGGDRVQVTEFIKNVGGAFDLTSGKVRIGLRESCGRAELQLNHYDDTEHFISSVINVMETDLSGLIYNMRQSLAADRANADSIAILLVSGKVEDMDKALAEARRLKYKSTVIVVGIGKNVDRDQLKGLASYKNKLVPDISHVFPVEDVADLAFIVKKLHILMCKEQ